jgi:hypothetical protein
MLESMVGRADTAADQLTSVTRALTSAYYVIPSAERLMRLSGDGRGGDAPT